MASDPQLPLFADRQAPPPGGAPEEQGVHLLALARVRGVGDRTLGALYERFPHLPAVWDASSDELRAALSRGGGRGAEQALAQIRSDKQALLDTATRDLERLRRQGIQLLTDQEPNFPPALVNIPDPVHWLFVQGNAALLRQRNLVAVVGTRAATEEGVARARQLTAWLAARGFAVVSGLAEGIDATAHQTALDFGAPTIGVLGTGILLVFPASTGHIRKQMVADGGAVITEYLPNESYSRQRFIRRNRIQAALSFAVSPVEAEAESGTVHTLRFAERFGRLAFGVVSGSSGATNGAVRTLRANGHPVFDLESPESLTELEALLAPALDGVAPPKAGSRLFAATLAEFRRVISTYGVSDDEYETLKRQLDDEWSRWRSGRQRHSPGP